MQDQDFEEPEATTLGGKQRRQFISTRSDLDAAIGGIIGAVGVCGLLRLAAEHFAKHPNPGRYEAYKTIPKVLMIAEGMVRRSTDELDDDEDDAANDEFEIDRFTEYGLLLHQLSC